MGHGRNHLILAVIWVTLRQWLGGGQVILVSMARSVCPLLTVLGDYDYTAIYEFDFG